MRKIKYLKKEDIYAEKFIKLPKKVFYNEKLTPNCKIIYAEILNLYSLSLNGDKGKRWRDSGVWEECWWVFSFCHGVETD